MFLDYIQYLLFAILVTKKSKTPITRNEIIASDRKLRSYSRKKRATNLMSTRRGIRTDSSKIKDF
jgi:hypothetical protein